MTRNSFTISKFVHRNIPWPASLDPSIKTHWTHSVLVRMDPTAQQVQPDLYLPFRSLVQKQPQGKCQQIHLFIVQRKITKKIAFTALQFNGTNSRDAFYTIDLSR